MKRFLTCVFLLAAGYLHAQYSDNPIKLGDKAFQDHNYYEAAYYYKKAAEHMNILPASNVPYQPSAGKNGKRRDPLYIYYQLAESYRLYEDYQDAEGWYRKTLADAEGSRYPLARLWYAVCLRATNHQQDALAQLKLFMADPSAPADAQKTASIEMANCVFALEQYRYPVFGNPEKLGPGWNADGSNYALNRTANTVYFTSSRTDESQKRLNKVYYSSGGSSVTPILFSDPDPKDEVEYGTPSATKSGNRMYVTKWYKDGKKDVRAIFLAEQSGGKWQLRKMNSSVNVSGYNSMQPFVTPDGGMLYFVSNRPGGSGRYDIWSCRLNDSGDAMPATNPGPAVNTAYDEEAPWFDVDKKRLLYSSKGLVGMGGFDVFETRQDGAGWTTPVNLGYPVNSPKDDLYYVPYANTPGAENFYLSSDRASACCLELFSGTRRSVKLAGKIMACASGQSVRDATVRLTDSLSGKTVGQVTTGADGLFSFTMSSSRPTILSVDKPGYFSKRLWKTVPTTYLKDTLYSEVCLTSFTVGQPIVLQDVLYDFGSAGLRDDSKRALDELADILEANPSFKVELSAHTDSVGSDASNLQLSNDRAVSCVRYLVSKGISEDRLFARGYGRQRPVAPNSLPNGADNPEGRQLNRRTEFTVLKIDPIKY